MIYGRSLLSIEEAAYIAGFIDADGHIGIVRRTRKGQQRKYLRPVVQIGQAKRGILDWISARTGGEATIHSQRNDCYNLRFHAGNLRWLLPQILPYLIVKKRQAEIVLEFLSRSAVWRNGKALSQKELAKREALRVECSLLNVKPRQKRRSAEILAFKGQETA